MKQGNEDYGTNYQIIRVEVGSGLHGTNIVGYDDHDEMGVAVEPLESFFSYNRFEQYIFRTQDEGVRSGFGDTDLVVYSLYKYLKLALDGNPTILQLLFVPPEKIYYLHDKGVKLLRARDQIISRLAGKKYLGYMRQQEERLTGERGGKHTNRPELIERYGFDCYLDDTEFLTRTGWKTYDYIREGTELGTINPNTGQIEFQIPTERVSKSYSGPITSCITNTTAWAVTPNHRMFVSKAERGPSGVFGWTYDEDRANWKYIRADEMADPRYAWHVRVTGTHHNNEADVISDSYLNLLGAYVSEGCVGKRLSDGIPSVLRFEQKDGGRLHAIMEEVERAWPLRTYRYPEKRLVTIWTLANPTIASSIVAYCGEGSHNKRLPSWINQISTRQARILLEAMIAGDGTDHRSGGWVYYTASKQLADDTQILALIAGYRAVLWGPYDTARMYQVRITEGDPIVTTPGIKIRNSEVTDRRIVCFTVPNETLITRYQGKVAMHGNTKYAMHMIRLGLQGIELLETGTLTFPMAEPERSVLIGLRQGSMALADVLHWADELETKLRGLCETSDLPPRPSLDVPKFLMEMYIQ